MRPARRGFVGALSAALCVAAGLCSGCEKTGAESVTKALEHAQSLVEITEHDVAEVRQGLPKGALELGKIWSATPDLGRDPEGARGALGTAQNKVQDLR